MAGMERNGKARTGLSGRVTDRKGKAGMEGPGAAEPGMDRNGAAGGERIGMAMHGSALQGKAGLERIGVDGLCRAGPARQCKSLRGEERQGGEVRGRTRLARQDGICRAMRCREGQGTAGVERTGGSRTGPARHGRNGTAGICLALTGIDRPGSERPEWQGKEGIGLDGHGTAGEAWPGKARHRRARQGRLGVAGPGTGADWNGEAGRALKCIGSDGKGTAG